MAEIDILTATIAAGQSLSGQVDIGNKTIVGLMVPSSWLAASITFQVSIDGGATWGVLADSGTSGPYTVASVAGGQGGVAIDPTKLRGFSSFKIQSGTGAAPTVQTGGAVISLITRLAI